MPNGASDMRSEFITMQERYLAQHGTVASRSEIRLDKLNLGVSILEAGAGKPVLLLHGGGASAIIFEPLLSRLQHYFHLYVPDRPGCGLTDDFLYKDVLLREHASDFVEAVLDGCGIDKVTLLGNSIGGYFSIVFALAHPERVHKLVLLGAPTGLDRRVPLSFIPMGIPYVNRLFYRPSVYLMKFILNSLVANKTNLPENIYEVAYAVATLPGATESWLSLLEELISLYRLNPRYHIHHELKQLEIPTLFIWGDKDFFAKPSSGEHCCAMMQNAKIAVIHGAGHLVWIDRLDRCTELIIDFVQPSSLDETTP